MARKLKNKQKQKQKQSQRVVVNIDNSRKTIRRKESERQPQQPRVGTTIINNIPAPIYQQQQPSLSNPQPNQNIFRQPAPPVPPVPQQPQINQNYYDEQFDRINTNINNLNNRFNQHAGNLLNRINNLQPTQNFVYVQPQRPEPANAGYNIFGEDDDITVQSAQTIQSENSNFTAPSQVNIRQPNSIMTARNNFNMPNLIADRPARPFNLFDDVDSVPSELFRQPEINNLPINIDPTESQVEQKQVDKGDDEIPINRQDDLLKGNYQNEAERNYICPICGRIDSNIGNSNRHLRNDHIDKRLNDGEIGEKVSRNKKIGTELTYTTYPEKYVEDIIENRNRPGIERGNEKKTKANKARAEEKRNKSTKQQAVAAVDELSSVGQNVEATIAEKVKPKATPQAGGNNKIRPT